MLSVCKGLDVVKISSFHGILSHAIHHMLYIKIKFWFCVLWIQANTLRGLMNEIICFVIVFSSLAPILSLFLTHRSLFLLSSLNIWWSRIPCISSFWTLGLPEGVLSNPPCPLVRPSVCGPSWNISRDRSLVFSNFGPPTFGRKGSYKITPVVS